MNTLTGIEAERVNQILLHATERLQILSFVPRSWDEQVLMEINNESVENALRKQWMTEEQVVAISDGFNENGGKDFSITKQAHKAARATCRNIVAHKSSMKVLSRRPESQPEEFNSFIRYLNDLRSIILSRMTTTVEDEAAHRTMLHDLTERERHLEESRDTLQKKLDEVIEERNKVTITLDTQLRKLQNEIQDISQVNQYTYCQLISMYISFILSYLPFKTFISF